MRKLLLALSSVALLLACGEREKRQVEEKDWPAGLGKLSSVPARYPDRQQNASADRLIVLAQAAGVDLRHDSRSREERVAQVWVDVRDYIRKEIEHAGVAPPDPLPESVVEYLTKHEAALAEVRQHLLTAPPAEWPQRMSLGQEAPIPNHLGQIRLARLFVASALQKREWDSLHAAWKIDEQLHARPDLTSHIIAVAIVRQINGAARSMPLPEPAWIASMRARDYRRPILEAMQAEAWVAQQTLAKKEDTNFFDRLGAAEKNEEYITTLKDLASQPDCTGEADWWWNDIEVPELREALQGIGRLRIDMEGTEKLALARQGKFDGRSRCPGQKWVLENGTLRFSRKLPAHGAPTEMPVALPAPAK